DGVVVVALLLDASAHGAVPFDVDSERDATQRSRPTPGRPTGWALPGSTIPRLNPKVESRSLEPLPSRSSSAHETVGRGRVAVPLRDVSDQPVTTRPNPRCRRRCRMEARKRQRDLLGSLRKGP